MLASLPGGNETQLKITDGESDNGLPVLGNPGYLMVFSGGNKE